MKIRFMLLLLIFISMNSYSNYKDELIGEWDSFRSNGFDNYYMLLKINKNLSGVFATTKNRITELFPFTAESAFYRNGFIEITLQDKKDRKRVLVVSAWDRGDQALLTGSLFFFRKNDNELTLFNTLDIRMIKKKDLFILEDIKELIKLTEEWKLSGYLTSYFIIWYVL